MRLFSKLKGSICDNIMIHTIILQVYIYSYLYEADNEITKAQMHMHAPLVLGMATGTAWSFGLFVVSTAFTVL